MVTVMIQLINNTAHTVVKIVLVTKVSSKSKLPSCEFHRKPRKALFYYRMVHLFYSCVSVGFVGCDGISYESCGYGMGILVNGHCAPATCELADSQELCNYIMDIVGCTFYSSCQTTGCK